MDGTLHGILSVVACGIAFWMSWEFSKFLAGLLALGAVVAGVAVGHLVNSEGHPWFGLIAAGLTFAIVVQPSVLVLRVHLLEKEAGVEEKGILKRLVED